MNKQPTVKILIGYHKPAQLLKSDILVPIHLGRALAMEASKDGVMSKEDYRWMLDNMIGDDTGENISHLNRHYCELTAIYWAWKNYDKLGNPDYIGFMHYRRHFIFNTNLEKYTKNSLGLYEIENITSDYLNSIKLNDKDILSFIENTSADFYITENLETPYSVKENFKKDLSFLNFDDLTKCQEEIVSHYPDYKESTINYLEQNKNYWYGSFIMSKKIFFEYCEWLFTILFGMEAKLDRKYYTIQQNRILAFLGERLLGIFYTHQNSIKKYELKMSFIKNTNINKAIQPVQNKNNVALCFSSNDKYYPYLSVTLQSIVENKNSNYFYDITVLHTDICPEKCKILKELYTKENVNLRFFDMSALVQEYSNNFFTSCHISAAAYYRFFIPEIFNNYDRVLYLDCDLITNKDISELYNTDIGNNLLGVCRDTEVIRFYKSNNLEQYLDNTLELNDYCDYFNSGVMIFNIKECIKFNLTEKLLDKLKKIKCPLFWDQDIFNCVCENKVFYLNQKWNFQWHLYISEMEQAQFQIPTSVYKEYIEALNNPFITHYTSEVKPWLNPELPFANSWWQYARMTPFYEEIIYKNIKQPMFDMLTSREMLIEIYNYKKNRFRYYRYKILSKITFGKMRKKYKKKRKDMEKRLMPTKQFLKY